MVEADQNGKQGRWEMGEDLHMTEEMNKDDPIRDVAVVNTRRNDEDDENAYTVEEEWAIVGRTVDHCFFVFFTVAFILGTIFCFLRTRYIH